MNGHDILLIGEDTSKHKNNAVWAYHMETHALTRISTVVQEAETTGVWYHENINGWSYIMNQVQHPDGLPPGRRRHRRLPRTHQGSGTAAVGVDNGGKKAIELNAEAAKAAAVSGAVSFVTIVPAIFAAVLAPHDVISSKLSDKALSIFDPQLRSRIARRFSRSVSAAKIRAPNACVQCILFVCNLSPSFNVR